jgi:hypothetical protein
MGKRLTVAQLSELRELIDNIDYRLVASDGMWLTKAGLGEVLFDDNSLDLDHSELLKKIIRIRAILGLRPNNGRGRPYGAAHQVPDGPADVPLREQLARDGKLPSYRDRTVIAAKRAATNRKA